MVKGCIITKTYNLTFLYYDVVVVYLGVCTVACHKAKQDELAHYSHKIIGKLLSLMQVNFFSEKTQLLSNKRVLISLRNCQKLRQESSFNATGIYGPH